MCALVLRTSIYVGCETLIINFDKDRADTAYQNVGLSGYVMDMLIFAQHTNRMPDRSGHDHANYLHENAPAANK